MKMRSDKFLLCTRSEIIGTAERTYRRAIRWRRILDYRRGGQCYGHFYGSPSWRGPRSNRGVSRGFDIVIQLYGNPTVRRNNPSRLRRRWRVTRVSAQKATLNFNSDDVAPQDDPLVGPEISRRGDLAWISHLGGIAKRSPTWSDRRQSRAWSPSVG